jgi:hypothetical protein
VDIDDRVDTSEARQDRAGDKELRIREKDDVGVRVRDGRKRAKRFRTPSTIPWGE